MNHISNDELLKYSLELLDNENYLLEIQSHLDICQDCRDRLDTVNGDIDILSGIEMQSQHISYTPHLRRKRKKYGLFKAAAILIMGFMLGYGASSLLKKEPITVTPSTLKPSPPPDSLLGQAASDATSIESY